MAIAIHTIVDLGVTRERTEDVETKFIESHVRVPFAVVNVLRNIY